MNHTTLLRAHVSAELAAARAARRSRDTARAWRHLERAHILSQPSARLHTRVHAVMILLAIGGLDVRELFGQLLRIAVAGIGSVAGRYPIGNTGRARVSINASMPIPPDLQAILDDVEARLAPAVADLEPSRRL